MAAVVLISGHVWSWWCPYVLPQCNTWMQHQHFLISSQAAYCISVT